MLQRASLCRALVHEPQLLMLDEPFGALDQFTREELWAVMQELWMKLRPTVLLVTHDLKEAGYLANRICVMRTRPGQIIDDAEVPFPRPRTIEMSYTPDICLHDAAAARADRVGAPGEGEPVMNPQMRRHIASTAFIIGFFLLWEALCWMFGISDIVVPKPSQIIVTLFERMPALWPHTLQTLYTTLVGFAFGILIGILLGMLIGSSRLAYDVAYPLLVGFASIPKVAVVPIFVLWFGSGTVPAILTAMIMSIFPIVVNVATGLATTEPELEDVMRALRASKLDILWNVGLPRTMPYFFASLKVAVTLAFVGTVISETVASNRGIGNVMMIASSNFDVPLVFAGLLILAVMGVALYAVFSFIESRITGWAHRKDEFAMG